MPERKLEIGPGARLPGFEGVDIRPNPSADYIADARKLPFETGSYDFIYASHVIEHFPWYETVDVLREWARVLKPGGSMHIWTVDAIVVARRLIEYEQTGNPANPDGWKRFNPTADPYLWCCGRLFAYGKTAEPGDPHWHKALFTPKKLEAQMRLAGLGKLRRLSRSEIPNRAHDHGVINLGVGGTK